MMKQHHQVSNISVKNGTISLTVDGEDIQCNLGEVSNLLATATEEALNEFEVSPSGYGIHWLLIDEDISIDGLLGIVHSPETTRKSALG